MWRTTMMLSGSLLAGAALAQSPENKAVPELDLGRYAGTWHEVARLPMFFQRKCIGDVTATYTALPDGDIEVRNACRTRGGGREEAVGVARPVPGRPGELEVRFAPGWLSWLPAVWADYWVIALDPDYQWAVVGGPSRKSLWILSRTRRMDGALYQRLVDEARARGYRVEDLLVAASVD